MILGANRLLSFIIYYIYKTTRIEKKNENNNNIQSVFGIVFTWSSISSLFYSFLFLFPFLSLLSALSLTFSFHDRCSDLGIFVLFGG